MYFGKDKVNGCQSASLSQYTMAAYISDLSIIGQVLEFS